jgi:hypothetical protein
MPGISIKVFHQPYFSFKNSTEPDFKAFTFDDGMKVKDVIAALAKDIEDKDLPDTLKEGKNLSLYD